MLLGDRSFSKKTFPAVDFKHLASLTEKNRSEKVNRTLLEFIQKEKEPCFLLAAVLDFIERVDREGILEHYTFSGFELWLNQHSGLSFEDNLRVRAKIVGKWVERSAYQALFPIGMGKVYEGSHFVTAHKSPDLDTTIASFWGWVDAFAARVGDSLHVWNLPGGPPSSQVEIQWIFSDLFGPAVFTHLAKTRTALHLTGYDLMTQIGMVLKKPKDSMSEADHERDHNAVVLVDEEGFYLGDWRSLDVESVHQVIILLSTCLRWFENHLHLQLISLFAKKDLHFDAMKPWLMDLFTMRLGACEPAKEFTNKQKKEVSDFLVSVIGIKEGLSTTFEQAGLHLARLASVPFEGAEQLIHAARSLFDEKGKLLEERPRLFSFLELAIRELHHAILKIRNRLEKFDIALKTKAQVFGRSQTFVTLRSEVEEIQHKMGSYTSLTVTSLDQGRMFPVGVIAASQLRKSVLGTVSLRDFCNRNEMGIPPYLDVISVIDHHKSQLSTFSPPFAIISDAQSSNTLVAGQAFIINDPLSTGGQSLESIDRQIKKGPSNRILQRLLQRRAAAEKKSFLFIDPEREYIEYLHFLYGILDDTDLLSKVSVLDVECVVSLLNRLKSLNVGEEVEVVSLDDLPKDASFLKKASQRILQNEDMYSLYRQVYAHREKEVAEHIKVAADGKVSYFFADTKVQNGCARVGQTKCFPSNIGMLSHHVKAIQHTWLTEAMRQNKEKPEVDLHIHMTSTVVSAEEVYKGLHGNYAHKDEMWIWAAQQEVAIDHLKRFLNAFQASPGLKENPLEVEFLGTRAEEFQAVFQESFLKVPSKIVKSDLSFAIIRYRAGSLNSRKAMVSPFLPEI